MCGLVGVIGDIDLKAKKAFSTLLLVDTYRGKDSTGVLAVTRNHQGEVTKTLGGPWNFSEKTSGKSLVNTKGEISQTNLIALMGHNRYATTGEVNLENAHPFRIGNVVGMHNGTLDKESWTTFLKEPGFKKYTVDSQVIFRLISEAGPEEMYHNLSGAMACVWWNSKDKEFYFLRNYQRTLFCCFNKMNKQLFYASEEWMLIAALARADIQIGSQGIMHFGVNELYKVGFGRGDRVFFEEVTELKPAPYKSYANKGNRYEDVWSNWGKNKEETKTITDNRMSGTNDKTVELDVEKSDDFALGYRNNILTKKMWELKVKAAKCECASCLKTITWSDKNSVSWPFPGTPVCNDCKDVGAEWVKADEKTVNKQRMN